MLLLFKFQLKEMIYKMYTFPFVLLAITGLQVIQVCMLPDPSVTSFTINFKIILKETACKL